MDYVGLIPSSTLFLLLLQISEQITAPDLHWSFERSCDDTCRICVDPDYPINSGFRLRGSCSNDTSVRPDNLVDGFIGEALFIQGIEAVVENATQSCITDLDRIVPLDGSQSMVQNLCTALTFSFWLHLSELPSSSRNFLFRTATFDASYAPETVGIGIAISRQGMIHAHVQAPGVFYEATSPANSIETNEWIHLILSWAQGPLNIIVNGTSVAVTTNTRDVPKPDRLQKKISFGDFGALNFTLDEVKVWFTFENANEVFQDAITPPTVPPTTLPEETTQPATTATSSVTTTLTTVTTAARPFYVEILNSKLAKVSKELYDNEVINKKTNFSTSELLTESSEKTIELNDNLAHVIIDEDIDLNPEQAIHYIKTVSENTNTFVASQNADTWLTVSEKTNVLNEIIENADNVTNTIVESIETIKNITQIQRVNSKSVSIMIVPTQTDEQLSIQPTDNVEIGLPIDTVSSLTEHAVVVVAASVYSGAQECYHDLSADDVDIIHQTSDNGTGPDSQSETAVIGDLMKFQIISEIVSVNIKPKPVNQAIRLSFRHIINISNVKNFTLYCAYIEKLTSRWTHHKCNIIETNNTHTTFISNHLTNFAILMQTVDFEISELDRKNLELITYIGLSVSVFCLVLSLCIFAMVNNVRRQRTERYHIHANLALGMLLGQITFLAGSGHQPGTDSCKATAILLHFFYLTSFSWMLVEGFHLYNLVVKVFKSSQSKLGYYYMIGWGLPLFICVISVSAAFDGYGEVRNCWLDMNNSRVIWAFVGPVLFVILVNVIILIKVTKVISSLAKSRDNCIKCMTDVAVIAVCVKAVAVLMPILGVTWIFGVIAVNRDLIVFQYIFAIFNSLQGFFLFVFHCVFNSETRSSLIYRTKSLRSDVPSKSGNFKGRRATKRKNEIDPHIPWNRITTRREHIGHDVPSTSREQSEFSGSSQSSSHDVRPTRHLIRTNRKNDSSPINAW